MGSKCFLVFENTFCRNQKKCYIAENVNLVEATTYSAPSQKTPFLNFSTEFLSPMTTEAITYSLIVFSHSLPFILHGFIEYNCGLNPLSLK